MTGVLSRTLPICAVWCHVLRTDRPSGIFSLRSSLSAGILPVSAAREALITRRNFFTVACDLSALISFAQ